MSEIVGVVLAGGRSRRFNDQDKGWQHYQGKPFIEHALQQLQGCARTVISANRNLDRYRALGVDVIVDQREDYQGPLSGIESVMQQWSDDVWFYVLACDVLGVPADWGQRLYQQAQQTASPWVGTLMDGRLQPLLGLWSQQLLVSISAYLDAGDRRVMGFTQPYHQHALSLPESIMLQNINSLEDMV